MFSDYTKNNLRGAVLLVNAVVGGWDQGATFAPILTVRKVQAALWGRNRGITSRDIPRLVTVAAALRRCVDCLDVHDVKGAAEIVNDLLSTHGATPRMEHGPNEAWEVHYHPSTATPVDAHAVGYAIGIAQLIGQGQGVTHRLGICRAERCDRMYLDLSRNGSKRFCSSKCMTRTKVAAFRASRSVPSVAS